MTVINVPLSKVWAFISNLRNMPTWTGVLKVEYADPVGVGTLVVATYRLMGQRTMRIRVAGWEPNRMIAMDFRLGAQFREALTLEPAEEGRTRLTISLKGEVGGLLRTASPLISYRAKREFSGRLSQVKAACEASDSTLREASSRSG